MNEKQQRRKVTILRAQAESLLYLNIALVKCYCLPEIFSSHSSHQLFTSCYTFHRPMKDGSLCQARECCAGSWTRSVGVRVECVTTRPPAPMQSQTHSTKLEWKSLQFTWEPLKTPVDLDLANISLFWVISSHRYNCTFRGLEIGLQFKHFTILHRFIGKH